MHILGGFHPGGSLNRICAYLGILDKLEIRHTDADAMDAILYGEDGSCYTLPTGKDAFTRYLQQQFPADSEGIKRYMDAMYALSYEVDAFYLRSSEMSLFHTAMISSCRPMSSLHNMFPIVDCATCWHI